VSRALAHGGARVILVNRSSEQGDEAVAQIKKEVPDAQVEWVGCDMADLKQVKEVIGRIGEKEDRLDLVNARLAIDIQVSPRYRG